MATVHGGLDEVGLRSLGVLLAQALKEVMEHE